MKKIKTKLVTKNIKQIDKAVHLSNRVKSAALRAKQRTDEQSDHSPADGYALEKAMETEAVTTRKIHNVVVRVYKNASYHRWKNRRQASEAENIPGKRHQVGNVKREHALDALIRTERPVSSVPPRARRPLHLNKTLNRKHVVPPLNATGKGRFIRGRVSARLLHRSKVMKIRSQNLRATQADLATAEKKAAFGSLPQPGNLNFLSNPRQPGNPVNRASIPISQSANRPTISRYAAKPLARSSNPLSPPSIVPSTQYHKLGPLTTKGVAKGNKKMFKTLSQSVKTGEKLYLTSVKKSPQKVRAAAETAQRTRQAARTARRSAQTANATMKLTLRIIKVAVKTAVLFAKGFLALIGASSSFLIILVLILAVAALVSSPFGIFFSDENKDNGTQPVTQIVQDINAEFAAKLEDVKQSYDDVDSVEIRYTGTADNTRINNWPDVLVVFAVKTTMDTKNGMDVATLDATRVSLIRTIFWDMNPIDSYVETIEHTGTTTVINEDGSTSEEATMTYEYILHITITSKTAEQQAMIYGFTDEQEELINEMMSGEFRSWLNALLNGETNIGGPNS